jgi:hypothetical protein
MCPRPHPPLLPYFPLSGFSFGLRRRGGNQSAVFQLFPLFRGQTKTNTKHTNLTQHKRQQKPAAAHDITRPRQEEADCGAASIL